MISPEEEDRNGLITIPDQNTSEAITYGSKYLFAKSSKWYWDAVEDEERKQIEELKKKIIDPEWALYVLNNRRDMIFSYPMMNDFDKVKDLRTMKEIIKRGTALEEIEYRRQSNLMYARMHGINEYCKQLTETGITEQVWKSATADDDTPIEYETLRAIRENDAERSRKNALETLEEEAEMKLQEELYKKETSRQIENSTADTPYEDSGIPIYKEIVEDKDYWHDEVTEEEISEPEPHIPDDPIGVMVMEMARTFVESNKNPLVELLTEATA